MICWRLQDKRGDRIDVDGAKREECVGGGEGGRGGNYIESDDTWHTIVRNRHRPLTDKQTALKAAKDRQAVLKAATEGGSAVRSGRSISTENNKDIVVECRHYGTFCHKFGVKHHEMKCIMPVYVPRGAAVAAASAASQASTTSSSLDDDVPSALFPLPKESATAFEIEEQDCNPDRVRVCLEDQIEVWRYEDVGKKKKKKKKRKRRKKKKTKKKTKKKKKYAIKWKDIIDGKVPDEKIAKHLKYLESIQYTDGELFIEFIKNMENKIDKGEYRNFINEELHIGVCTNKERK